MEPLRKESEMDYSLEQIHDIFSIMIIGTKSSTHKLWFKSFPHTIVLDEAARSLEKLNLICVNRLQDPRQSSVETTTYSHTRRAVKKLFQHFMDARLLEDGTGKFGMAARERGIFMPTAKGVHVVDQYLLTYGASDINARVFLSSLVISPRLIHLKRDLADELVLAEDDELYTIFRFFVGHQPNFRSKFHVVDAFTTYRSHPEGVALEDLRDQSTYSNLQASRSAQRYSFLVVNALDWLCDFTTIRGRDEAAIITAHFVRLGLITFISDTTKKGGNALTFSVSASPYWTASNSHGELRCSSKAIYGITTEGCRIAGWAKQSTGMALLDNTLAGLSSSEGVSFEKIGYGGINQAVPPVVSGGVDLSAMEGSGGNYFSLADVIAESSMLGLLHEFLRERDGEGDLEFWLAVDHLGRIFRTSFIVVVEHRPSSDMRGEADENNRRYMASKVDEILAKYLMDGADHKLSISSGIREEAAFEVNQIFAESKVDALSFNHAPLEATTLQTIISLFERVQLGVFQSMENFMPEFNRTPEFTMARAWSRSRNERVRITTPRTVVLY